MATCESDHEIISSFWQTSDLVLVITNIHELQSTSPMQEITNCRVMLAYGAASGFTLILEGCQKDTARRPARLPRPMGTIWAHKRELKDMLIKYEHITTVKNM